MTAPSFGIVIAFATVIACGIGAVCVIVIRRGIGILCATVARIVSAQRLPVRIAAHNRRARTVALRVPPTAPISPAAFAAVDLISKVALQLAQMPHRGVVKVHLPSASAIANAVIRKSFQHKQQASRDHGAPYLILSV